MFARNTNIAPWVYLRKRLINPLFISIYYRLKSFFVKSLNMSLKKFLEGSAQPA